MAVLLDVAGFLITLVLIVALSWYAARWIASVGSVLLAALLIFMLVFVWVPAPFEPVLGPVQALLIFLINLIITTMLNGIYFIIDIPNLF